MKFFLAAALFVHLSNPVWGHDDWQDGVKVKLSSHPSMCLTLDGSNAVTLKRCRDTDYQVWYIDRSNRIHSIMNEDYCLRLDRQSPRNFVVLARCVRDPTEFWRYERGRFKSANMCMDFCISCADHNVHMQPCKTMYNADQKFDVVSANGARHRQPHYYKENYVSQRIRPNKNPFQAVKFDDDDCELLRFVESFCLPRASKAIPPGGVYGNPAEVGTTFVWNVEQVYEIDGTTPFPETIVTGTCTRTGTNAGYCNLSIEEGDTSIDIGGVLGNLRLRRGRALDEEQKNCLHIDAGTSGREYLGITTTGRLLGKRRRKEYPEPEEDIPKGDIPNIVGFMGEMVFSPQFSGSGGDIFLDIIKYEVEANVGLLMCPQGQFWS